MPKHDDISAALGLLVKALDRIGLMQLGRECLAEVAVVQPSRSNSTGFLAISDGAALTVSRNKIIEALTQIGNEEKTLFSSSKQPNQGL